MSAQASSLENQNSRISPLRFADRVEVGIGRPCLSAYTPGGVQTVNCRPRFDALPTVIRQKRRTLPKKEGHLRFLPPYREEAQDDPGRSVDSALLRRFQIGPELMEIAGGKIKQIRDYH
jgi:hypothetical protein